MTKAFADLESLPEDDRIDVIGNTTMTCGNPFATEPFIVGFIVESEEKADRYIEKLKKKFPEIVIIGKGAGPVKGTVAVRVGPPASVIQ